MLDRGPATAFLAWLSRCVSRWKAGVHGGVAVTFAMSLPVVLGILGVASDYAMLTKVRGDLQATADAAAMAGAREIPLAKSDPAQVASAVRAFAAYRLTKNAAASPYDLAKLKLTLDVAVTDDFAAVEVTISEAWTPFFAHFVNKSITPVKVTSKARFVGNNNVCILGLSNTAAVFLDDNSLLTANKCGVFSNATDSGSVTIDPGAKATASIICGSGGVKISSSATISPQPVSDCPPVPDPLAGRPMPTVGACDHNGLFLKDVTRSLDPGVYCGGLTITGTSKVTLNPGIYVLKDGAMQVSGSATFGGEGVGFFVTGAAPGKIQFTMNTHVSLTAPVSGAMAGLLIMEDRNLPLSLKHQITSDDARTLIGTIYLPVGSLVIDAKKPVADQSAYTAIVARSVELNKGPNLVLNSNYNLTDVPVPQGIAGSSQVVLAE